MRALCHVHKRAPRLKWFRRVCRPVSALGTLGRFDRQVASEGHRRRSIFIHDHGTMAGISELHMCPDRVGRMLSCTCRGSARKCGRCAGIGERQLPEIFALSWRYVTTIGGLMPGDMIRTGFGMPPLSGLKLRDQGIDSCCVTVSSRGRVMMIAITRSRSSRLAPERRDSA